MKDFVLLILQIVVVACVAGIIGTLLNYFLGWHISYKGAELPSDLRAAGLFLVLGGVCAGISYLAGRQRA